MIPVAVTTGVGPQGRRVVHHQAPENIQATNQADNNIDPTLRELEGTPTSGANSPPVQSAPVPPRTPFGSVYAGNPNLIPIPPTPSTPTTPSLSTPNATHTPHHDKENSAPAVQSGGRRPPQTSAFTLAVKEAQARFPTKRSIDEQFSSLAS